MFRTIVAAKCILMCWHKTRATIAGLVRATVGEKTVS